LDPGTVDVRLFIGSKQCLEDADRSIDVLQAATFWGASGVIQVQELDLRETVLGLHLFVSFERGWGRHSAKST
jgi:hypothetical protein